MKGVDMDSGLFVIDTAHLEVGEGPFWDEERQLLHVVAFREKHIRSCKPVPYADVKCTYYPGLISFLGLSEDGHLLAGTENDWSWLNADGSLDKFCDIPDFRGIRLNDGKVGPDGRFYGGSKNAEHTAALYRVDSDKNCEIILENVGNSNGLDWSADGKTFYYCDSEDSVLAAYDFDISEGSLSNKRILMGLPEGIGAYDGMCIDAEGMLWCAVWGSSKVYRINPNTAKVVDSIKLPASQVSCCSFAGDNLDILVITTSAIKIDLEKEPMAGFTFGIKLPVTGVIPNRFKTKK